MKQILLTITYFALNIGAYAQWDESQAGKVSTNDNVIIGADAPITINSDANLFPSQIPFLSLRSYRNTGEITNEFITLRNTTTSGQSSQGDISRRIGFLFKLSNENSLNESNKMGGLMLESNTSWANAPDFHLLTKNLKRMTIKYDGKIGIGTTQPSAQLQVEGGNFFLGEQVNSNAQRREIRIYGYDNDSRFYGSIHTNFDDSRRTLDISTSESTNRIKIDASSNEYGQIAILPGNKAGVSIGTLKTGGHKLAVEGSIGAREVKVEATVWSDFVFKDDYELRSIEETEQFILKNKHLPDIPNEKEVVENGINLGEMDAKLLQKIEELTLYLIDQNKLNKALLEKVTHLEKELNTIRN